MTSFTFTAEQVKSAPPEVRRWIENEIGRSLAAFGRPAPDPAAVRADALAACSFEEAVRVFERIQGNFLVTQLFFELGRDLPDSRSAPPLHILSVDAILHHTRLSHVDQLVEYYAAINQVFQQVRQDAQASLFGFDPYGHLYLHEVTHQSVRRLWEQLVAAPPAGQAASAAEGGFGLPHLGPSEPVAGHRPSAGDFTF